MVVFHSYVNLPEGNNVKRKHYHSIGQLWTLYPHEKSRFHGTTAGLYHQQNGGLNGQNDGFYPLVIQHFAMDNYIFTR